MEEVTGPFSCRMEAKRLGSSVSQRWLVEEVPGAYGTACKPDGPKLVDDGWKTVMSVPKN